MQLLFRSRIFVVLSHFNGPFHFSSYGKMNLMFESVHRIALKRYIRYGEIKFSPVRGVNIQKDFLFQERFAMFREISFFRIHTSKTRIDIDKHLVEISFTLFVFYKRSNKSYKFI